MSLLLHIKCYNISLIPHCYNPSFHLHVLFSNRHRAAHVDNYVKALLELHKQFHWPLPPFSILTTPTSRDDTTPNPPQSLQVTDNNPGIVKDKLDEVKVPVDLADFKANMRRPNRPPDLSIPTDAGHNNRVIETDTVTMDSLLPSTTTPSSIEEEVIVRHTSSTPSKLSAAESYSLVSESFIKSKLLV